LLEIDQGGGHCILISTTALDLIFNYLQDKIILLKTLFVVQPALLLQMICLFGAFFIFFIEINMNEFLFDY